MGGKLIMGFKEEKNVAGERGLKYKDWPSVWDIKEPDLSDCLVNRVRSHPWWIVIWEPLSSKVPNPNLIQVWTCYANTVIFYARGYILDDCSRIKNLNYPKDKLYLQGKNVQYLEYGRAEWKIRSAEYYPKVIWENEVFEPGPGRVVWKNKMWWMLHLAKRINFTKDIKERGSDRFEIGGIDV